MRLGSTLIALLLLTCVAHAREEFETGDPNEGRGVAVGANLSSPAAACFRCHGVDGKGDSAAAFPRLSRQAQPYLYAALKDYASGARENAVMSPIARQLSDKQMRDVSAFYAAQASAPARAQGSLADPELLQHGAAIAAVGNARRGVQGCINCHGPAGRGLGAGFPYLGGQYANYIEAQLRAWKSGARKSDRQTSEVMGYIARQLSEEDIRAVALYYGSIRAGDGDAATPISPLPGVTPTGVGR